MTLNRLLEDPELQALITRVEAAFGTEEIPRAIERAYAVIARKQQAQLAAGETPDIDSLPAMRAACAGNSRR